MVWWLRSDLHVLGWPGAGPVPAFLKLLSPPKKILFAKVFARLPVWLVHLGSERAVPRLRPRLPPFPGAGPGAGAARSEGGGPFNTLGTPPLEVMVHLRGGVRPPPRGDGSSQGGGQTPP